METERLEKIEKEREDKERLQQQTGGFRDPRKVTWLLIYLSFHLKLRNSCQFMTIIDTPCTFLLFCQTFNRLSVAYSSQLVPFPPPFQHCASRVQHYTYLLVPISSSRHIQLRLFKHLPPSTLLVAYIQLGTIRYSL